jgi:hypothetical protein
MTRFRRRILAFSSAAGCLALALTTGSTTGAASSVPQVKSVGTPIFVNGPSATPPAGTPTVHTWSSSFTYGGVNYPYTMMGTSPFGPDATTVTPTEIIPIKLVFSNGGVMDGTKDVPGLVNSPMFQPTNWKQSNDSGVQYGDAIFRSQFNKVGSNYHLELGQPTVRPTVTIDVPSNQGQQVQIASNGVLVGLAAINWFSAELQNLMQTENIDPTTLPLFITDNTYLYIGNNPNNCCVGGFHGAGPVPGFGEPGSGHGSGTQPVATFAWATYGTPGTFAAPFQEFSVNTDAFSHEVSEWQDDPFVNNIVPSWSVPSEPQYGCSSFLETGDPLVIYTFSNSGYILQDEAFFSWFARQDPSIAQPSRISPTGRYTYLSTFTTFSPSC